jgi:methylated-DNA-[protein]-cysteine S-methyltransferase
MPGLATGDHSRVPPVPTRVLRYAAAGWGVGELWLRGDVAVWHELPRAGEAPGTAHPLTERLVSFFAGTAVAFDDVALDPDWSTPFEHAVGVALRSVGWGEVVTYGELAALAGHPGAQRAVGSFCARNTLPLFVPCHRVVAASGLGSYGPLGAGYKQRLLALEGHAL